MLSDCGRSPGDEPALVIALPELSPAVQSATLAVLVEHADSSVLQDLVARFQKFGEGFQAILLRHVAGLDAALGGAIRSSAVEARLSAIELIARSQSGKNASLLAEALRSGCPITRKRASVALREMTASLVDSTDTHSSETQPPGKVPTEERSSANVQTETRSSGTVQTETRPSGSVPTETRPSGSVQTETQPSGTVQTETRPSGSVPTETKTSGSETRQAQATFLADALAAAVLGWEHHFRLEVLEAALWLGGKVEWAIREKLQESRTRIARPLSDQLSRTADPRLAEFVLRALAIPELRPSAVRAIERAKDPSFIRALTAQTWLLSDPQIKRGCRWIRELRWLGSRSEVLLALDRSQAAGAVRLLGATGGSPERKMEILRKLAGADDEELPRAAAGQIAIANESDLFQAVASGAGTLPHHAVLQPPADPPANLRARFAQAKPLERLEALRTVWARGLTAEFAEEIYHLAHDPAEVVRSSAVAMLAELPTARSRRILRAAVDDPDAGVQASAIEALDILEVEDRRVQIEPKLVSPDSRVRARAVKSLLPLEVRQAGDVLLDMLEDSSCAHRLGALWVIERLELRAAVHRVRELCVADSAERVRKSARRVVSVLAGDSALPPDVAGSHGWNATSEGDDR